MSRSTKTYITKSIERLYGIIEGISIDCSINDKEIAALHHWIDAHEFLHGMEPFKGLSNLLREILEDGVIDMDERDELIEWCAETINEKGFLKDFTTAARRLHGVFSGIVCDATIKKEELEGLQDWLLDYELFQDWWPFNKINQKVNNILKDGKVDDREHQELQEFFQDFAEQIIENSSIHDAEYWLNSNVTSPSPIFKPINSLCEKDPNITFKNNLFCFTGPAASGKRKDLFKVVKKLGGNPTNKIVNKLDYLVIGAQSSPAWVYSTYGRKIEEAIDRNERQKNFNALIIKEDDFVKAVIRKGGADIIPDPNRPAF